MKRLIGLCLITTILISCKSPSSTNDSSATRPVPVSAMITFDGMSHANRKPNGWHAGIRLTIRDDKMVATLPNRHSEAFWTLDCGVQDVALTIAEYAESDSEARARGDKHFNSDAVMRIQYWVKYSDGSVIHGLGAYRRLSELPRNLRDLFEESTMHAIVHIACQDQ